jgi:predicted AAA+ superfamily ATPase
VRILRDSYRRQIQDSQAQFRITALVGPRQCGKTTLARTLATRPDAYSDLEDPLDLAGGDAPRQTLGARTGLVVIDEVRRRPDLFPLLRVLADRDGSPARFLILGSASLLTRDIPQLGMTVPSEQLRRSCDFYRIWEVCLPDPVRSRVLEAHN